MGKSASVAVGSQAPDFTLPNQNGDPVTLSALLREGPVVLYFYPKDETPGCTVQACAFRDQHQDFLEAGATVVGVSTDSVQSHRSFSSRHALPFILLADADDRVRSSYGVAKTLGLFKGRVTFVIDSTGEVLHSFDSQIQPRRHVAEALQTLARRVRAPQSRNDRASSPR